jgi:hypothetical protein
MSQIGPRNKVIGKSKNHIWIGILGVDNYDVVHSKFKEYVFDYSIIRNNCQLFQIIVNDCQLLIPESIGDYSIIRLFK